MSTKAIDYKIILKHDGQTQQQRMPQWLDPSFVPVDARTKEDFFNYIKTISKEIKFYDTDKNTHTEIINGTWEEFFALTSEEVNELAAKAALPSHIALWQSFMQLYQQPQELMNGITKRHLDFYYGDVLRLGKRDPVADTAHVVFELKKNTEDILLKSGSQLSAGKDGLKKDLHYRLTHDIVVNRSKVADLKSLFVNPANKNFLHVAPVANSADGAGAELDKANPKWNAFGYGKLPLAQVGFCLAGHVLKMKEGERKITVTLTLNNLSASAKNKALTSNLFSVSITGEKGWIGPKTVSADISSPDDKVFTASFSLSIGSDEPAITEYNAAVHGLDFSTGHPLLQVLINNNKADFGYNQLMNAEVVDARIDAEATGIKDLQLENDFGTLNAKKPFTPFSPSAERNTSFSVGCEEAFSKRLKEFAVDVEWKNIPAANLGNYFSAYGSGNANKNFTATAEFKDGINWRGTQSIEIFKQANAKSPVQWNFTNPAYPSIHKILYLPEITLQPFKTAGQTLEQKLSSNYSLLSPAFTSLRAVPFKAVRFMPLLRNILNLYRDIRKGVLTLRLNHNFLFKEHREKYTAEVMRFGRDGGTLSLPGEPFSPEIQSIEFSYKATTANISFSGTALNDYIDEEIELFHYGAFGQIREHAYNKSQHSFLGNTLIKLLPEYKNEGEFLIGLSGLKAEDAACILFQTADGSANPDKPKVDIQWSVLCDNYWKELTNEDFIFDTTNDLLTSGVIKFVIPGEATTVNTLMPNGLLWLKASIKNDSDGVCNLTDVKANAAIALFKNNDNDLLHLSAPLASGTIKKLEPETGAIKSVQQPYSSFGGQMQENDDAYYIRVSERLRHKQRSITLWDYERLILQHFPKVHKIKCINHASLVSFYDPGNTMIITVPDLTNQNAVNPFQPRVDKNTLDEINTFLINHSSSWVEHHVRNPFYEPVKISVALKLKRGFEFNYYEKVIDKQLQQFLSPWINSGSIDIHFGGKITKSMIVKFLEDLEFVDFLTDFKLFHSVNGGSSFGSDKELAEASNPAAILVSSNHHKITNS